ncbi:unnamed protein product [Effrenium voratum]|nr:unnamed protein product [Effrenium voratum]
MPACVKELVENALDASARRIEVRLRENGAELLEVVDDGRGICAEDFEKVLEGARAARELRASCARAARKLRERACSANFSTYGFRGARTELLVYLLATGEALSAICAMGDLTIATKTETAAAALAGLVEPCLGKFAVFKDGLHYPSNGMQLHIDRYGKLLSSSSVARDVGTTVSVRELFKRLPVRHKEFTRNAKAQVNATLRLLQSYAIAQPEVRFAVVSEKLRGTQGANAANRATAGAAADWHQAAAAVLGDAALSGCARLRLEVGAWRAEGLVSSPGAGRRHRDIQLFFVNGRPIDAPKRVVKLINDTYHQYNSRAWPLVILAFTAPQGMVDVNVTPDKKTVFLHQEDATNKSKKRRFSFLST